MKILVRHDDENARDGRLRERHGDGLLAARHCFDRIEKDMVLVGSRGASGLVFTCQTQAAVELGQLELAGEVATLVGPQASGGDEKVLGLRASERLLNALSSPNHLDGPRGGWPPASPADERLQCSQMPRQRQ